MLETSWEALENAGHPPERFAGPIGVFAGCGMGSYFYFNLCSNPDLVDSVGLFLLASPTLFLMGASLVYFVILPFVLWFSLSQQIVGDASITVELLPSQGSSANLELLREAGLMDGKLAASPNDLLVAVRGKSAAPLEAAIAADEDALHDPDLDVLRVDRDA